MSEKALALIADFMTAAANCSLYSETHEAVLQFSGHAVGRMDDLYRDDDTMSLTVLGDRMLCNEEPIAKPSLHVSSFIKRMRRKRIEKIVFKRGVTAEETAKFIAQLSSYAGTLTSSDHISVGALEVKIKSDVGFDVSALMQESVSKVKEVYHGISKFRKLDIMGLEDVVINFMATLKREANILRIVSPVKSYSEYTFTHTTNVTVLSIFQAEALGMKGEVLHEIGLAGLLHDVGKMFIPKDVLDKEARLTAEEWALMKKHTIYGAMYLSALQDVPKLAVITAFEHHMKFNGSGYPDTKRRGKNQHIVSQIVAISDFFDALRTERTYRRGLKLQEVIGLMREASGRDFNPILVESFIGSLNASNIL